MLIQYKDLDPLQNKALNEEYIELRRKTVHRIVRRYKNDFHGKGQWLFGLEDKRQPTVAHKDNKCDSVVGVELPNNVFEITVARVFDEPYVTERYDNVHDLVNRALDLLTVVEAGNLAIIYNAPIYRLSLPVGFKWTENGDVYRVSGWSNNTYMIMKNDVYQDWNPTNDEVQDHLHRLREAVELD